MAGRAKGAMVWKPTADVQYWVNATQNILDEYSSYGPMTVRQVFYRLVGQYGYQKDERAYKRLAEYLVKARRAGMIRFGQIRDDGTTELTRDGEWTRKDTWDDLRSILGDPGSNIRLNRNDGQPYHIELWCEAAGMAPMLAQMVRYRDISVYSTGGFSSVTVTHQIASRVARRDKPTYLLHVGDYDPSGESIFTSMSQDTGAFVASMIGGYIYKDTGEVEKEDETPFFIPKRVALTESQVAKFDLPTAPAKVSDSRSASWIGSTTQAEAMPPDLLETVVTGAVSDLTDTEEVLAVEAREQEEKERVRAALEDLSVQDIISSRGLDDSSSLYDLFNAIAEHDMENDE